MSLPILIIVVALGIAAIVFAVHLSGGGRGAALSTPQDAATRFSADHPDRAIRDVWLTTDGRTAFLALDGGGFGAVHTLGSKQLTRVLGEGDIAETELRDRSRLKVRFRDFTWRGGEFTFADMQTARAVLDAMPLERRKGGTSEAV